MIVRRLTEFSPGYTPCLAPAPEGPDLAFGILRLRAGEDFRDQGRDERLFHLLGGSVSFGWDGGEGQAERHSLLSR